LLGFYDGDGTLGYDMDKGRIRPRIASSEEEFLLQIKEYFIIEYQISSTKIKKYNLRTRKLIKILGSRLDIGIELFEEMLRVYSTSLKRKRVPLEFFEDYFKPKKRSPSAQQIWLKEKLSKETLQQILKVLSPNKIAVTLGVSRETIVKFIENYGLSLFDASYYMSIERYIYYHGRNYELYDSYHRGLNYLEEIGKFNDS
jgi:hypothetical protein